MGYSRLKGNELCIVIGFIQLICGIIETIFCVFKFGRVKVSERHSYYYSYTWKWKPTVVVIILLVGITCTLAVACLYFGLANIAYNQMVLSERLYKLNNNDSSTVLGNQDHSYRANTVSGNQDHSYRANQSDNRLLDEGGWRCKECGRINASYTGTCGCGMTKQKSIASR